MITFILGMFLACSSEDDNASETTSTPAETQSTSTTGAAETTTTESTSTTTNSKTATTNSNGESVSITPVAKDETSSDESSKIQDNTEITSD